MRHLADIKADVISRALPEVKPEDVHRAVRALGFRWTSRTRWGSLAELVRVCYQLGYVLSRRPRAKAEWFGHAPGIVVLKLGDRFAEWLVVADGRRLEEDPPRVGGLASLGAPPTRDGEDWVWYTAEGWESWAESRGYTPRWGSLLTLDAEPC